MVRGRIWWETERHHKLQHAERIDTDDELMRILNEETGQFTIALDAMCCKFVRSWVERMRRLFDFKGVEYKPLGKNELHIVRDDKHITIVALTEREQDWCGRHVRYYMS